MAEPLTRFLRVIDSHADDYVLKVAFATTDRMHVNQHFGTALAFSVYGVNPDKANLLGICEFSEADADETEDKLRHRICALADCGAVYCRACGTAAVRQLLEAGIQPVRVTDDMAIDDLLLILRDEIRQGPSRWLARAIQQHRHPQPGAGLQFDSDYSWDNDGGE